MKVLVTGGAGFIGHKLCDALLADGHDVEAYDRMMFWSQYPKCGVWPIDARHVYPEYDMDYEAIFHLATHNITECAADPRKTAENMEATAQVVRCARKWGAKLIYASSCSVYGNSESVLAEDSPPRPTSAYGISKLAGEHLVRSVKGVILRLSNVYGPGQTPLNPGCGVVSRFMDNAIKGLPLRVYDPAHSRDYTYIDDVVNAFREALYVPWGTFNIASGENYNTLELAKSIATRVTPAVPIEDVEPRSFDDVIVRRVSAVKFQTVTPWQPQVRFKDGLDRTWEWMEKFSSPVI